MKPSTFDDEIARLEKYLAESEPVFQELFKMVEKREDARKELTLLRTLRNNRRGDHGWIKPSFRAPQESNHES